MVTELELLFHLLFFIMLGRKDRIGLLQYQGKTVPCGKLEASDANELL